MCTRAVKINKANAPRSERACCWGHPPFIIPTHNQPGRVGHNSDRSIAHNHCSSAFFFLSNYHSLKCNQWYCAWLFGTWKCRHGTWQSLHFNHCNREQICSTLLVNSLLTFQLVWTQDQLHLSMLCPTTPLWSRWWGLYGSFFGFFFL